MLSLLLLSCIGSEPEPEVAPPPPYTGPPPMVAVGDVTHDAAMVWVRAPEEGAVTVTAGKSPGGADWTASAPRVDDVTDYTALLELTELPPGAEIFYQVTAGRAEISGRFKTAPAPDASPALSLAVIGDLGGQGHCRLVDGGYPIFNAITDLQPDLVIANGDMIYADGDCPAEDPGGAAQIPGEFTSITKVDWTDPLALQANLGAHWRYNRSDPAFQSLLLQAPIYAQWDDHEAVNDFGGEWRSWLTGDPRRPGFANLVAEARTALFRYNPIRRNPDDIDRIYRSFRFGAHVEIFLLDARSYRSSNLDPDGPSKTMLGRTQRAWLLQALARSTATWKIVSSDVPISIPTGTTPGARDGWASLDPDTVLEEEEEPAKGKKKAAEPDEETGPESGFEQELAALLAALEKAGVENLVFVTTDVHRARSLAYSVDPNEDGTPMVFHEFVSGPLRAWQGDPGPLDPTFQPESLYAEGGLNNFSWLHVTEDGSSLTAQVVGEDGQIRPGSEVTVWAAGAEPPPTEEGDEGDED